MLARHVERVAVVGRDEEREGPLEAVPQVLGGPAGRGHRPDFDVAELPGLDVVANDDAPARAGSGGARPHDIRILGIRRREAALTTSHAAPVAARDDPVRPQATRARVRRTAEGRPVLAVSEHVVRDRVVDGHVVHLRDRKLDAEPGLAAVLGQREPAIERHDEAVAIRRVEPDVVEIPAGRRFVPEEVGRDVGLPSVQAHAVAAGEEVDLVPVVGGDAAARVVGLACGEVVVVGDEPPALASVLRAPELARVGLLPVDGHTVSRLDEGVDPVRVVRRVAEGGLSGRAHGKPVALQAGPGVSAVAGDVNPAAGPSALAPPGLEVDLPHRGHDAPGIGRVHDHLVGARVLVDVQHTLPGGTTVHRAVDPSLLGRRVGVAEGRHVGDVRIVRVDQNPADPPRALEPHVGPGVAGVRRLPHAIADRDVRSDRALAGAGPNDGRVRRRHGQCADRVHGLVVEDRLPVQAGVLGLPDPSRGRARVVGESIAGNAGHGRSTVADGTDVSETQLTVMVRGDVLSSDRGRREEHREGGDDGAKSTHVANLVGGG